MVERLADVRRDFSEVGQTIHATVEIGPDGLDLRDAEEKRMHETEDVECHLLR